MIKFNQINIQQKFEVKISITLRAKSFANRDFCDFRDFGFFSRKFMPSKKVSGKFAKVIFAKTKLFTKIAKDFSQF